MQRYHRVLVLRGDFLGIDEGGTETDRDTFGQVVDFWPNLEESWLKPNFLERSVLQAKAR
jgi:hypothetical protein